MQKHFTKLTKPKKSAAYPAYWTFADRRNKVFYNRISNQQGPWTNDPVIQSNRFTNVFRAADRVSQFLVRTQYNEKDPVNTLFKTLLFKIFNKIETYSFLEKEIGLISIYDFSLNAYDKFLTNRFATGKRIYSAAYIMPSAGSTFGHKFKHTNHLALLEMMFKNEIFQFIVNSKSLEEVYNHLLSYPSLGSFLAFQYAIDINYSTVTNFSEMDFVVAGPGAKNGILKCFKSMGDYSFEDIIKWMADNQEAECAQYGIESPSLWGRRLQLIDCQNLFCEVDKYLRVTSPKLSGPSGRTRIKQKFKDPKGPIEFFFPPKWNINETVNSSIWHQKPSENIFS